ncbi:conserved hypothetical protein [Solidesulfovibrio fructosivorans JJ]]|uniref:Uncharacterized protein n=1 Tax=Solidesulfovibrio fructosivorans JJ] TaxID=596151 RepID=E1JUS3_SOLFR|nr:hypothetical protein [Solidesulfovibrio fructosivorans]EFL51837.1 conserved hypothetical protein [Solidesulfovibrio fructosivorans JJ]]
MNVNTSKNAKAKSDAELEAEAIRELERMERALNAKKSGYRPKRRRAYADHR